MTSFNDERQRELFSVQNCHEPVSPLSNRFLVAQSSPVHETHIDTVSRLHEDSFQSSSSTSNSKSSSSATSRSSRLQYLLMHHHQSAVNSPLMYSRCTSLGSLASYDIRSSCNESYTSECSSVKPSGIISPSDIPDSPPCEPEIIEEDQPLSKPINRTLTLNTTSSHNRTTMMSETVIEKTFIFNQQQHRSINNSNRNLAEFDDDEHLDEVIVYAYETTEINEKSSYENQFIFDDDSYRVFTTQTDETDSFIDESVEHQTSFPEFAETATHENLSVITEESSFIEDLNSNEETNSIRILYDLIKKPHWTKKSAQQHVSQMKSLSNRSTYLPSHSIEDNGSISSNPSSLSLDSISGTQTDDEDEYDQEKGRQLIQRLIEETLARRSLRTDFLHSISCVLCPSNGSISAPTRTVSSSSTHSIKSCTCTTNKYNLINDQPQRSRSSPARPSSTGFDESKRVSNKSKEKPVQQTRSSFLRLRQAQQNKRLYQSDKRI